MSELADHPSPEQLRRYRSHAVSGGELREIADHLGHCSQCRSEAQQPGDLEAAYGAFQPGRAEEHLTSEEIADYVAGVLNSPELARVRSHLGSCAKCGLADNELRAFRAEVEAERLAGPVRARPHWTTALLWLTVPGTVTGMAAALFLALQISALQQQLRQEQARAGSLVDLERRATSLEKRKQELEKENTRLAGRVPTLQRETEGLRKNNQTLEEQLRQARAASPDTVIRDGSSTLIVGPEGNPVRVTETEPLPQLASAVLRTGELPLPEGLGDLLPPAPITRSGGVRFQVRGPAGTRITEPRPKFQWDTVPQADRYEVVITESKAGAVSSEYNAGTQTTWTAPEPLRRGARYEWQVRAYTGEELIGTAPQAPATAAVFQILSAEETTQLQRDLAAAGGSPLQRAVAYARAGLLPEVEQELEEVVRANPGSARVNRLAEALRAARNPKKAPAPATQP